MSGSGGVEQLKEAARAVWSAGDYDAVSEKIWEVGQALVDRVEIQSGDEVLDVAAGTGNATIPAALAAGRATGLDLTPELFAAAGRRAVAAGADVKWVEGDAEALPFEDGTFDVVLSTFGVMFAPRHDVAAAEMARVLRPGGRLGICSWTPEGAVGDFFRTMASFMPPPPDDSPAPPMWGAEDHVRGLFEGTGVELECERDTVTFHFDSIDETLRFYEENFGPVLMARKALEPQGRWPEVAQAIRDSWERGNTATDGTVAVPSEYLRALGRKRA